MLTLIWIALSWLMMAAWAPHDTLCAESWWSLSDASGHIS